MKRRKPKIEDEEGGGERKNIKEMGDVLSGNTSEIVQVLLSDIMKCFLHSEKQIRTSSLQVVSIILRQGLVHPVQVRLLQRTLNIKTEVDFFL